MNISLFYYWFNGWSIGILCGAITSIIAGGAPVLVLIIFIALSVLSLIPIFVNEYSITIVKKGN